MSGNPDVLEYYRSKSSRKPIRTIDLQECEVTIEAEVRPTKRQYQNQHLFVVKTTTRIFYLLAKTAEEMNVWVQNIGQICTFGGLNRHAGEEFYYKCVILFLGLGELSMTLPF